MVRLPPPTVRLATKTALSGTFILLRSSRPRPGRESYGQQRYRALRLGKTCIILKGWIDPCRG